MNSENEVVAIGAFASEISDIASAVGKIKALVDLIDENYTVLNTQEPTDQERCSYSCGCGKIYAYIGLIEDCVNSIEENIVPLAREV